MSDFLHIYGAKKNNLNNISLKIPYNKTVCFTGVSGSGKSSLVFGTIYQEARKVMSDLFLDDFDFKNKLEKTNVNKIEGLVPTVAFKQDIHNTNPRSNVGTYSKLIYNLRNIYTKYFSMKEGKEYTSSHFSPNSWKGMCPKCNGYGEYEEFKEELYLDKSLSLEEGAIKFWEERRYNYKKKLLLKICEEKGIPTDIPFQNLSDEDKSFILTGKSDEKYRIYFKKNGKSRTKSFRYVGVDLFLDSLHKDSRKSLLKDYGVVVTCSNCSGQKLKTSILKKKIAGFNISELKEIPISSLNDKLKAFKEKLYKFNKSAFQLDIEDIQNKIEHFKVLNLDYISLDRSFVTLSGGEKQRLKIANYLSNDLRGVLVIFDEPTSGLHVSQTEMISDIADLLKDNGNYIFLIEHNKEIIMNCDHIVELGPFGGKEGGNISFNGSIEEFKEDNESISKEYILKDRIGTDTKSDKLDSFVTVKNIERNNLKNVNIKFPLNSITCIAGVSGSGKSSLLEAINFRVKNNIDSYKNIDKVIKANQKSLTRSSRSTLFTYIKLSKFIRGIFGKEGKECGYTSRDFSLNTGKGRCEKCKGKGFIKLEMDSIYQTQAICPKCDGKKYKEDILEIDYQGKNILEVLNLTIEEAIKFFNDYPKKIKPLKLLKKFGLDYLKLGESSASFSGGEAQRIKLVRHLSKMKDSNNLIVFDEPSQGLHRYDLANFIQTLKEFSKNNTIVIAEHNTDIIYNSDFIIELGPESGENGGKIIAEGNKAEILETNSSIIKDYIN